MYKVIYKITREIPSRKKLIIEYFLVTMEIWNKMLYTKVQRGPEIGNNYYLLVMI